MAYVQRTPIPYTPWATSPPPPAPVDDATPSCPNAPDGDRVPVHLRRPTERSPRLRACSARPAGSPELRSDGRRSPMAAPWLTGLGPSRRRSPAVRGRAPELHGGGAVPADEDRGQAARARCGADRGPALRRAAPGWPAGAPLEHPAPRPRGCAPAGSAPSCPSAGELATFVTACAERQVLSMHRRPPLRRAPHRPTTGFVHHGFLNPVVATARDPRWRCRGRPGRGAAGARGRRGRGHRRAGRRGDQSALRQLRVLRRRGASGRPPRARAADCSMSVVVT